MSSKTYHIKLNGKVYEVEIEVVKEGQNVAIHLHIKVKSHNKKLKKHNQ